MTVTMTLKTCKVNAVHMRNMRPDINN